MPKIKKKEYKEIEDILNDYVSLNAKIKLFELNIEKIKINAFFESDKSNGAGIKEEAENKIQDLKIKKRKMEIVKENVENVLSTLSEKEYKFVELRYFKKLKVKEMAKELFVAEPTISFYRSKILDKLTILKECV